MREKSAPGAEFCFPGALDEDIEVFWKGGEERKHSWKESALGVGRGLVDFVIEDGVEEDFE